MNAFETLLNTILSVIFSGSMNRLDTNTRLKGLSGMNNSLISRIWDIHVPEYFGLRLNTVLFGIEYGKKLGLFDPVRLDWFENLSNDDYAEMIVMMALANIEGLEEVSYFINGRYLLTCELPEDFYRNDMQA